MGDAASLTRRSSGTNAARAVSRSPPLPASVVTEATSPPRVYFREHVLVFGTSMIDQNGHLLSVHRPNQRGGQTLFRQNRSDAAIGYEISWIAIPLRDEVTQQTKLAERVDAFRGKRFRVSTSEAQTRNISWLAVTARWIGSSSLIVEALSFRFKK